MTAHLGSPSTDPMSSASLFADDQPAWAELFRQLRERIDRAVAQRPSPPNPTGLALAVVAEALAIGEAMSEIQNRPDQTDTAYNTDHTDNADKTHSPGRSVQSPALYAGIDSHYLDHRTRALRAALHGVDDYVWWGGLSITP